MNPISRHFIKLAVALEKMHVKMAQAALEGVVEGAAPVTRSSLEDQLSALDASPSWATRLAAVGLPMTAAGSMLGWAHSSEKAHGLDAQLRRGVSADELGKVQTMVDNIADEIEKMRQLHSSGDIAGLSRRLSNELSRLIGRMQTPMAEAGALRRFLASPGARRLGAGMVGGGLVSLLAALGAYHTRQKEREHILDMLAHTPLDYTGGQRA
jgi:hypothetical protein